MTTPQPNPREELRMVFATENERKLAKIMFEERPGLANAFAQAFDIQFIGQNQDVVYFLGTKETEIKVDKAFDRLVGLMSVGQYVNKEQIRTIANELNGPKENLSDKFNAANQNTPQPNSAFAARSEKQKLQAELIDSNDITFSVGPAGTGKTHVAMIKAVEALKSKKVARILLARPALEAGEKIGFQPGDQNQKMAPYLRPLYDELDKAFGPGKYTDMIKKEILEIVPIGFMRGRTFENAFIVIDEAQNCKFEQLKMAVTRLGPGSKMVITGDPEQIDLTPVELSGLKPMLEKLEGVEGVGVQRYSAEDVVRHPTVMRIIENLEGRTPSQKPTIRPENPSR